MGLVLMGKAMFNKSLIQFSVDEWCYIPSLLFDLRPNYGGGNEDNGDLLQKVPCVGREVGGGFMFGNACKNLRF